MDGANRAIEEGAQTNMSYRLDPKLSPEEEALNALERAILDRLASKKTPKAVIQKVKYIFNRHALRKKQWRARDLVG